MFLFGKRENGISITTDSTKSWSLDQGLQGRSSGVDYARHDDDMGLCAGKAYWSGLCPGALVCSQAGDNIESEISPIIAALEQAVRQSDASKAAALWSVDGEFIDDAGQITRGRHELKERFSRATGEKERQAFTLLPDGIKHPSANVALVDGVVLRDKDGVKTQTSRFSYGVANSKKKAHGWRLPGQLRLCSRHQTAMSILSNWPLLSGNGLLTNPVAVPQSTSTGHQRAISYAAHVFFHGSNQSEELSKSGNRLGPTHRQDCFLAF